MDSKRKSHHEGNKSDKTLTQYSKRRREDSQQAGTSLIGNWRLRPDDIVRPVANMVQRMIREELDRQLVPRPSGGKFFKLVFKNDLPATIYTNDKIKAKGGRPVEIALYDNRSKSIVTDGPLSSIRVKIYVLNGEFGSSGSEDLDTHEFKANISRPRKNKGELLKGNTVITLNDGVGQITIMFTDNSKCTRSRHFRLGAIVQSTSNEANIKEAISNRFMVKDCRGELNQKHYPPLLSDEVWRLENISKDGTIHGRLSELGVNTVEDLLQLHETKPSLLQEKFGKGSTKLRKTIKHAETCSSEVTPNGQNCRSQNALISNEKHASRNVKDFVPVAETAAHSFPGPSAGLQIAGQCSAPYLQVLDFPTAQQALNHRADQLEIRQDFSQASTSTSHIGEAAENNQVGSAELLFGMCMEEIDLSLLESHVPTDVADVFFNRK